MPLPKRQAFPVLRVPPAQVPIVAATDQHRSGRTPGQRVHDHIRLAPGLQALPTLHIPDEELPATPNTRERWPRSSLSGVEPSTSQMVTSVFEPALASRVPSGLQAMS